MKKHLIVSCEHGGNTVPLQYKYVFEGHEDVLDTHRALDFGALELAEKITMVFEAEYFFTTTTRLLIEANRSAHSPELYSEFTKDLPQLNKEELFERYYKAYRDEVEDAIKAAIYKGKEILHLSVHTFTPRLKEEVRDADIGLLFDPTRQEEAKICEQLKIGLGNWNTRFNYPYLGTDDGFTTYLRTQFPDPQYAGIEIEVNQKFPLQSAEEWNRLTGDLIKAIRNYCTA